MKTPVEVVLVGAGNRGQRTFGAYALNRPHRMKIVGVAEPDAVKRHRFAAAHSIPPENVFETWEDLMARPQLAPALINSTMDLVHFDSTIAALDSGYDVLMEKPMAGSAEECVRIVKAAEDSGRKLLVCHEMRYAPFFSELYRVLHSGQMGDIVNVEHSEHIGFWHFLHSFVRGAWRSTDVAASALLQKCCHDLDLLVWALGAKCTKVASFGGLRHFVPENAPEGAPERCTDGCPVESTCPHYAPWVFTELLGDSGLADSIFTETTPEGRWRELAEGPFGRCAYRCDNNVVDHQVLIMEFEGGISVSFTMQAHSHDNVRIMRYSGTRATVCGHTGSNEITVDEYRTGAHDRITPATIAGGHGGGDWGLLDAFVETIRGSGFQDTSARNSLESHLIGYAAEEARLTGAVIDMNDYRARIFASAGLDREASLVDSRQE